ncbi:hypothetical protein ACJ6WF_35665 [Streptomyces sp. MMS24-I2-30]|uniref:hypothetical protein n=1 Tax=Streptomyces sp. MMS24-I2-30 TaxID=3351564 RepID=UPI003896DC5A
MNRWIRRVSVGLASAALAGGAVLGAGGAASAAVSQPVQETHAQPAQHAQVTAAALRTGDDRIGYHGDRYGNGYGYGYGNGYGISWPGQPNYSARWDGRHAYFWDGNGWNQVTPWRGIGATQWYVNQYVWYLNHR